jgi:AcrR family transcriptional regulator
MRTPDRILRADAQNLERDPPELTPRELEQYTRILAVAEGIIARRGIHTMSLSGLAHALCMGHATLRRHFSDLDVLLATLIGRHLRKLACAIGEIPREAPDRPQKMRAAYLAYTRADPGRFTDAHLLLVRDRHLLPEDLLANIERTRRNLGETLLPGFAEEALAQLDIRALDAPRIEAALAAITTTTAEQPKPPPPAPKQVAPTAAPPRRDRTIPATPPWAPRDDLSLLRGGPRLAPPPTLPDLSRVIGRLLEVHSSA